MNFFNQLLTAIEQQNSLLYVALEPDPDSHIFAGFNCGGIDDNDADIVETDEKTDKTIKTFSAPFQRTFVR